MEREVGDEPLYSIRDWSDGPEDIGYFRRLKRGIIDHQLMRCKSLQELCRQRLRKQFRGDSYVTLIETLNYPQKLKNFLLKFPESTREYC